MTDLVGLNSGIFNKINPEARQEAAAATNPISASIAATDTVAVAVAVDSVRTVAVPDGLASLIRDHVKAINALGAKLAHAGTKIEQYQAAIGQHIKAIKLASPDGWENIVKAECNLGRSRAYELLAIADGTKTVEQVRAESAERKAKERAKSLRDVTEKSVPLPSLSIRPTRPPSVASRSKPPSPPGKALKLTRHDVVGWFNTASVKECQRVLHGLGSRKVATFIPPAWDMLLFAESVLQVRDALALRRDALALPRDDGKRREAAT
jgi:hypothetical protein